MSNVNHPKHYKGNTSLECIQCMELILGKEAVYHFCLCNAFKYLWRYESKNGAEDVDKAKWYLEYVADQYEKYPISAELMEIHQRLSELHMDIKDQILKSNY